MSEKETALILEIQMMYADIKDCATPKEALEKLAGLEPEMGWTEPIDVRVGAYMLWLEKNGKHDWVEYLGESLKALARMSQGFGVPDKMPKCPEGWIPPGDAFRGVKR